MTPLGIHSSIMTAQCRPRRTTRPWQPIDRPKRNCVQHRLS
jgi:hypothetical protein